MIPIGKIREYIMCPQFGDKEYGAWGGLRLDQRQAYKDLIDIIEGMEKEIERLNNRLKTSNDTCNYLRNTIDKAIEYIDRRDIEWGSEEHNKLLNILKGSDK